MPSSSEEFTNPPINYQVSDNTDNESSVCLKTNIEQEHELTTNDDTPSDSSQCDNHNDLKSQTSDAPTTTAASVHSATNNNNMIHGQQIIKIKIKDGLRKGKWTPEEEVYTNKIIEVFNAGLLKLGDHEKGITLRAYLADKLGCDPMRITKKYTGASCLGKRVYHFDYLHANHDEAEKARAELEILEGNFRMKLEQMNRRRMNDNNANIDLSHMISTPAIDALLQKSRPMSSTMNHNNNSNAAWAVQEHHAAVAAAAAHQLAAASKMSFPPNNTNNNTNATATGYPFPPSNPAVHPSYFNHPAMNYGNIPCMHPHNGMHPGMSGISPAMFNGMNHMNPMNPMNLNHAQMMNLNAINAMNHMNNMNLPTHPHGLPHGHTHPHHLQMMNLYNNNNTNSSSGSNNNNINSNNNTNAADYPRYHMLPPAYFMAPPMLYNDNTVSTNTNNNNNIITNSLPPANATNPMVLHNQSPAFKQLQQHPVEKIQVPIAQLQLPPTMPAVTATDIDSSVNSHNKRPAPSANADDNDMLNKKIKMSETDHNAAASSLLGFINHLRKNSSQEDLVEFFEGVQKTVESKSSPGSGRKRANSIELLPPVVASVV